MSDIWTQEKLPWTRGRKCSIEGCEKKHEARGLCKQHVTRLYRHGNPSTNKQKIPLIVRFEEQHIPVTESGCWIWTGSLNHPNGYGCMTHDGKRVLTHRFAYEHFIGPIPKGLLVLHKCDTPSCVNPSHLFVGTYKDNVHDAIKKKRFFSKLTNEDVEQIKILSGRGMKGIDISKAYGVDQSHVCAIVRGENRNVIFV